MSAANKSPPTPPEEYVSPPISRRLLIGGLLAGTTVVGCLALTAPFVISRSPLPYMATPGYKIRRALEFVQKKRQLLRLSSSQQPSGSPPPRRSFIDLGSGDGEGVYQAVSLTGDACYDEAVGVELNTTLYLLSQIRRLFYWTPDQRRRSRFLRQDFFTAGLSQADTCLIFGVTPLMAEISRTLRRQAPPGTHVLAYRFALPLATAAAPDLLQATIVYDEEEMRVYECQ